MPDDAAETRLLISLLLSGFSDQAIAQELGVSPRTAQRVANAVGEEFSERISEESPVAEGSVTVTLWEQAALPKDPVSPAVVFTIGVALVVGMMLGVGLAFLLEYFDDSWRSPEEVEELTGLPVYGIIPSIQVSKGKKGGY